MNEIRARDIMNTPLFSVGHDDSALEVAKAMKSREIGGISVEKDGKFVGIITKKDLVWRVLADNKDPKQVKAHEIMSSPLITADIDDTLSAMARKMAKNKITRLVIVKKGNPVGVVSERDIVKVAPEQIELLSEYVRILK